MKLASALTLVLGLLATPLALAVNPYNMIPEPAQLKLSKETTTTLKVLSSKKVGNLGKEEYILKITPKGVQIHYSTPYGAAMAQSTLAQLKDALAESPEGIPCGTITDKPNFEWRGMMVDLGRYYYPMEDLKKFVDAMHYYKYNVLHLHLTEDQGWRLEIPGYDKLKTIGSVRPSAPEGQGNSLLANEGMYTAKEMAELVKYCAKKGIDVLPEIEFPGHNMALAASYPEFCCNNNRPTLWTHGGVSNRLICPQKSGTKKFIKDVFNTVQQTFPFEYVHIGGDECPMGEWKSCPDCKKYRDSKGYGDDVEAEMSDFTTDLGKQLGSRSRKPILWYDINKSYYHKGETVMSWLPGEFPRVIDDTKNKGLNLIVTPQFKYYFARCQQNFPKGDPKFKPEGSPILLKDCYNFDPRNGRSAEETSHVKGINLCMWAEWIPSAELLMYMTFPRAIAVSENSWGDFNNHPALEELEQKLEVHKKRYQKRFGYTLERTPENKPIREDSITPERVKEINELFEKGQKSVK